MIWHYNDVIMWAMASHQPLLSSGADQRKHQSSAPLACVMGIHRWPVDSLHKWPVTRKMFPFDDVIISYKQRLLHLTYCAQRQLLAIKNIQWFKFTNTFKSFLNILIIREMMPIWNLCVHYIRWWAYAVWDQSICYYPQNVDEYHHTRSTSQGWILITFQ